MAVSNDAVERARALFAFVPELTARKMFGGLGLYSVGRIFAIGDGEGVYLKVDDETEARFEAAGSGLFVYDTAADGAPLTMRYRRLPDEALDDEEALRGWTRLALEAAARAAVRTRSRKRARPETLLISGPWDEER